VSAAVSGLVALALFMLVTVLVFQVMDIAWNTQVDAHHGFTQRLEERQAEAVDVEATADTSTDCLTYTATVANNGETVVADFTEMDLLVQYTDSGDTEIVSRLVYTTDWTVSMSPDDRDPNAWNPDETATITFALASAPKDDTRGTVLVVTPRGVVDSSYFRCICEAGNTIFTDASAQVADTGGNNDGFEVNPTNAFSDGAGFAENINGNGDRHRFYNYGLSVKNSCGISGIEVRLDWWLDSKGGANSMDVELSWDGGTSWTAAKTDSVESTTEHTSILGGPSDTWGRIWSGSEFNDSNFRLRVTSNGVGGRNHYLDWVPVKVYYAP